MPATVDPRLTHGAGLLAAGAAVLLSWQMVYRGTSRLVSQTRAELTTMRQEVEHTEHLLEDAGGAMAWMTQQQRNLQQLQQRLPSSRDLPRLLDTVLGQVSGARLTLVNITQGNPEPAKTAQGEPILLNGLSCLGLPVSLTVEGRYHTVRAYLEQLTGVAFPGVVTITQVEYVLKDPQTATLTTTLQLLLYVVGT